MTARPAPYPPDTRAKGWRFELDMEQVRQSDTWALTPAEARPWLIFLWAVAWEQTPCGSLPNNDALIVARLEVAPRFFAKHRECLLRGWWLADDGRLYHNTLVQRVLEMLKQRRSDADRQAANRAKKLLGVTGLSRVTPAVVQGESSTGTGTRTIETEDGQQRAPAPDGEGLPDLTGFQPTPGGAACKAIKAAGIPDVNPSHPDLQRLLAAGVTPQELADTAAALVSKGRGKAGFAYLLSTVEGQRRDAAARAAVPAAVPVTVPGPVDNAYLREHEQRSAAAVRPPPHVKALVRKTASTA